MPAHGICCPGGRRGERVRIGTRGTSLSFALASHGPYHTGVTGLGGWIDSVDVTRSRCGACTCDRETRCGSWAGQIGRLVDEPLRGKMRQLLALRIRLTRRFFSFCGIKKGGDRLIVCWGLDPQWNEVHIHKEYFSDAMKIIWPT
jgi:hypothetical protein